MTQLTFEKLHELADYERSKMTDSENVWYIAYLWDILRDLSTEFEADLQRDYEIYTEKTKEDYSNA